MTTYSKSSILKEAHTLYNSNKSMGWSWALTTAWANAKMRVKAAEVEARNNAILAARKAQFEAKMAKETAEYNANYIASPARYYAGNAYNGD